MTTRILLATSPGHLILARDGCLLVRSCGREVTLHEPTDRARWLEAARVKWGLLPVYGGDGSPGPVLPDGDFDLDPDPTRHGLCLRLPAQFDWDPGKHPHGAHGHWASAGAGTTGPATSTSVPRRIPSEQLRSQVAAIDTSAIRLADQVVDAADAAFDGWLEAHPGRDLLDPERLDVYRRSTAARAEAARARATVRRQVADILAVPDPVAWEPDTSELDRATAPAFAEAAAFVGRIVGRGAGVDVHFAARYGVGPQFSQGVVQLPRSATARAIAHEWGHVLEDAAPDAMTAARAFLERRAGGEVPTRLQPLYLTSDPSATGRRDDFGRVWSGARAYYVGRTYLGGATEVTAMGLEQLFHDGPALAQGDPDYFHFLVGVLHGHGRTPAPAKERA